MNNYKKAIIYFNTMGIFLILIYILISIYFSNHFYIGTYINGINISCKTIKEVKNELYRKSKDFTLNLYEKNGDVEYIYGQDIDYYYKDNTIIDEILANQNSNLWLQELLNYKKYEITDLFIYDKKLLKDKFKELQCFYKENIIEPLNPCFHYNGSSYTIIKEVLGNKINEDYLYAYIINSLNFGLREIDLDEIGAYEVPQFTSSSPEVINTCEQLNKYIQSTISYTFDNEIEKVDRNKINQWLEVDNSMNIVFNEEKIKGYVNELCNKYETYGKPREFNTSTGKSIIVIGGNYGWKIDKVKERQNIIENIESGQSIEREPIYSQKATGNRKNDIGSTYIEINLTRQFLWFYKEGKIITQGDIVTGNISRGFSTPKGTYSLNYKQKDATLKGAGYSSKVKYWMPFNCNIGIHDASWRTNFGGNIYKTNGSHGCVNAPLYLAKKVFENIEPGTPVICYCEE